MIYNMLLQVFNSICVLYRCTTFAKNGLAVFVNCFLFNREKLLKAPLSRH